MSGDELTALVDLSDGEPDEWEWPSYSDVGRILVRVIGPCPTGVYRHEYEVLMSDGDSSVHYIQEGVGFDYWLDEYCDFPGPGYYVIEGINGTYIRGDGWTTDDDEEWEHSGIRPATEEEIRTEALTDDPPVAQATATPQDSTVRDTAQPRQEQAR